MYKINHSVGDMLPREKMVTYGVEQLSDQELLALFLRTGNKNHSVLELSQKILNQLGTLSNLHHLSVQELQKLEGIGKVKSIELKAVLELAKRVQLSELAHSEPILGCDSLGKKMMLTLGGKKQEHLIALYLDTQNRIIEERTIFIGTVQRSIAEPREILYYACKNMATSIILVHNHPSGSLIPSDMDKQFTKKIKQSCENIGITCLDHLIVTSQGYYSFRAESDLFITH